MLPTIFISDYNYQLPQERIAGFPLSPRDHSKLLVYRNGNILDDRFYHLADHLPGHSTLVVNNTRVIEARLLLTKPTGGVIEIFCLEPHGMTIEQSLQQKARTQWQCLVGGASKWKKGQVLEMATGVQGSHAVLRAQYVERLPDCFVIEFSWEPQDFSFAEIIHAAGRMPLPPYIKREATEQDKNSYQTIFGKQEGSVAAPTAALHFTQESFDSLAKKNIRVEQVTLHVGAGTFKPVKSEKVEDHEMHAEPFSITKKTVEALAGASTVISVGTTSLRTIESVYWIGIKLMNGLLGEEWILRQWECYELAEKFPGVSREQCMQFLLRWMDENGHEEIQCRTSLIIQPGYRFRIAGALVTNFHQPQSTLLLLVSAFVGEDWKKIYQHALDNEYRFLSYGDSSLLWRNPEL